MTKHQSAQQLGKARWANTTAEERKQNGLRLAESRKQKRLEREQEINLLRKKLLRYQELYGELPDYQE